MSKQVYPEPVLRSTTALYAEMAAELEAFVNDEFARVESIGDYIGENPLSVMHGNHKHHVLFMAMVLKLDLFELLENTIPWVYRAYHSHGFSYDYFNVELGLWKRAVKTYLPEAEAASINQVYDWMLENHTVWIERAEADDVIVHNIAPDLLASQQTFLNCLLAGDHRRCVDISRSLLKEGTDLSQFYLMVVQPSMYDIGTLWEKGKVSVAQEHLATSIMTRVMSETFTYLEQKDGPRLKAIVTAAPNEYHELGAWMVSDLLEEDGWNVHYLGANIPTQDLLNFLNDELPDLLALSITMPFHIDYASEIIEAIRANVLLKRMKVIVGGQIFQQSPSLWKKIGADGSAVNAQQAVSLARTLCETGDLNAG